MMIVMKNVKRNFCKSENARRWPGQSDEGPATHGVSKP
jgi:hypothetical protein